MDTIPNSNNHELTTEKVHDGYNYHQNGTMVEETSDNDDGIKGGDMKNERVMNQDNNVVKDIKGTNEDGSTNHDTATTIVAATTTTKDAGRNRNVKQNDDENERINQDTAALSEEENNNKEKGSTNHNTTTTTTTIAGTPVDVVSPNHQTLLMNHDNYKMDNPPNNTRILTLQACYYYWNRMIWRSPWLIHIIRFSKLPILRMMMIILWILIRLALCIYIHLMPLLLFSSFPHITSKENDDGQQQSPNTSSFFLLFPKGIIRNIISFLVQQQSSSSLQLTLHLVTFFEQSLFTSLMSLSSIASNYSPIIHNISYLGSTILYTYFLFLFQLLQDMMLYYCFSMIYRVTYCCMNSSIRNDMMDWMKHTMYQYAVMYIPSIHQKVYDAGEHFRIHDIPNILKKDPDRNIRTMIPYQSIPHDTILQELKNTSHQENHDIYRGQISGTVYNRYDEKHHELMTKVYGMYSYSNPLHPGYWPKVNQCEAEVIAMMNQLLHGPTPSAIGCMTSGGTESILLTIRAHYYYYGMLRGISYPEIICSSSAHAAVDKACDIYSNIRKIVVPACSQNHYQLTTSDVISRISSNTIMIYASAPSYPHGVIDPISELSQIALQYNIGLHVDACLGGFILAFYKELENINSPIFDFRHKGVTSISIDTHKYGYSTKGTSVILYRHRALRHGQYFSYPLWTGGLYHTPTLAGSRSGGVTICAWASLLAIGQEEYTQRSIAVVQAARLIGHAIYHTIPELELFVRNPSELCVVVSMKVSSSYRHQMNIYQIQEYMKEKYGWHMNSLQFPPAIHICITLSIVQRGVDTFLTHLKDTIQHLLKQQQNETLSSSTPSYNNHRAAGNNTEGTNVGIYGTTSTTPAGPLTHLLNIFTDEVMTP